MVAEELGRGGPGPAQLHTLSRKLADDAVLYRDQLAHGVEAPPPPHNVSSGAWELQAAMVLAVRHWLMDLT